MGNLIYFLIFIPIIILIAYFVYKHISKKNKKKALAIITAGTIATLGVLYLIPQNIETIAAAEGNYYWFGASGLNAFFTTNMTIHFNNIYLNDGYTQFNNTRFIITSANRINLTIMYINHDIINASKNDRVLDFYANTTSGTVLFEIGGLKPITNYQIKRNSLTVNLTTSNNTGYISFMNNVWSNQHFQVYMGNPPDYTTMIRTYGVDYFVWLGSNMSAGAIGVNISGWDEIDDYLAILGNTGSWRYYYGDNHGDDFPVHTFDVIKTYLNDAVGNTTVSMYSNPGINYDASRTVYLKKVTNGYNYTGYTNRTNTTLHSINNTLTLPRGYFVGMWNRTIFNWNYWISGFGITNKNVPQYSVIMSKINADKTWNM